MPDPPLRLDHIAVAVWDPAPAARFWGEVLQGEYRQGNADWDGFLFAQFAYAGAARVELLSPASDRSGFLVKFLERHGEGVHHVTFTVADLEREVARVRSAGLRVFGESYDDPHWREAFVSPGLQGGRLLVQLAQSDLSVEEQDRRWGGHPLDAVLEAAARRGAQR